jgi:hypothetical protein
MRDKLASAGCKNYRHVIPAQLTQIAAYEELISTDSAG